MLIKYAKKVQNKPFIVEIGIKKTELSPPQEAQLNAIIKQKVEAVLNCNLANAPSRLTQYGTLWEHKASRGDEGKIGVVFITKVTDGDNIRFNLALWPNNDKSFPNELTILSRLQS